MPVQLSELAAATQRMLHILASQGHGIEGLRIRLATKPSTLLVLAEHDQTEPLPLEQLLSGLESALRSLLAELPFPDTLGQTLTKRQQISVRLFLRHTGASRPYKTHSFSWQASDALNEVFGEGEDAATKLLNPVKAVEGLGSALPSARVIHPQGAMAVARGADQAEGVREVEAGLETTAIALRDASLTAVSADDADLAAEPVALTFQPIAFQPGWLTQLVQWKQQVVSLPRWVWGAIAGLFAISSAGYVLSRPCVLGNCPRLAQAETLNQNALGSLAAQPSPGDVIAAHQDMQTATQLLTAIPFWSRHHDSAQAALDRYSDEAALLDQVITAQQSATEAAEKSQNPPHPMPRWIEIRLLWQRAIAQLRQLPPDNQIQAFTAAKLREYEANLAEIDDRIDAEKAAEKNLSGGMQAGQLALHHTENAQSFPGWQISYREWETAVNFLQRIPQGTLAYTEAQTLLKDYRGYLQAARDRVQNEQQGDRAYAQAIGAAQQARQYEQKNQWTLAVQSWRRALELAQQVPTDTALASSAQALRDPYRNALSHATGQLRDAIALQKLAQDLDQICGSSSLLCRYTIVTNQLRVTVNPGYDQAIEQTMTYPQVSVPDATFAEPAGRLLQHIATLGSNNQRIVELYDVQGVLIARYVPRYGGFVKN